MARIYNFSAGPSMLPEEVLKTAAAEMLEYGTTGQSVMEMSHRSKEYQAIIDEAEANLREIMNIPENYKVLFLQGGASTQFAMVPMNLMTKNKKADYIITGQWAKKAYKEAARYGSARAVASSEDKTFSYIHVRYARPRGGLRSYLHEQYHLRYEMADSSRNGQRSARCGYFELYPFRADRCKQVWRFVCRRAEERCARRFDHRHHS